jgi:peptidoglycan DL-endopeptidase LytE
LKRIIIAALTMVLILSFANISHAQVYVERGDTLGKIAKEHNMTLKDLINLNPHITNPNRIVPGDYIIVRSAVEKQKDLVDYARSLQESTTYVYGGQQAPYMTDCSGWVQYIYSQFGIKLPRTSAQQAATGKPVKFQDLQIGDLMFFSTRADHKITHVGIFMGKETNAWISNLNAEKDVEILSTWGKWTQAYFQWGARYEF